jgi:hypothetical protein
MARARSAPSVPATSPVAASAGESQRGELERRLAAAASDLETWVHQRQPLMLLLDLYAANATTEIEVSAVAHQARAIVEQAQAMSQQLQALREQLAVPAPQPAGAAST